jgi:hypothetical protein
MERIGGMMRIQKPEYPEVMKMKRAGNSWWFGRSVRHLSNRRQCGRKFERRLHVEALEDRRVLAVLTVNTAADSVLNDADNVLSLREAIMVVNNASTAGLNSSAELNQVDLTEQLGSNDTIRFAANLSGETITIDSTINDDDVNNADLDIVRSVIIDASALSSGITINGDDVDHGNVQSLIFDITGRFVGETFIPSVVTLKGLRLTGGIGAISVAGPIQEFPSVLTVEDSVISDNDGSGILALQSIVIVRSSIISRNTASVRGGGIEYDGPYSSPLNPIKSSYPFGLIIEDTQISDNTNGGVFAIANHFGFRDNLNIRIVRSTISNNVANTGAGLWFDAGPDALITVEQSLISGNESVDTHPGPPINGPRGGGGVGIRLLAQEGSPSGYVGNATLQILDSTISGNRALNVGGGISVNAEHTGTIDARNRILIANSTISGNEVLDPSDGNGGGLYISSKGNDAVLAEVKNTTITNNRSAIGAGLQRKVSYAPSEFSPALLVTLDNAIISENNDLDENPSNLADEGLDPGFTHLNISNSHNNLVGSGSNVTLDAGLGNIINEDEPLLGPLTNNGGPTLTHLPINDPDGEGVSPAIDAGSNAHAVDPFTADPLETDQRGFDRIVDGDANASQIVDIGSVEWQPEIDPACNVIGDYNRNGAVDAADYTVWRNRLGEQFTLPNEDPMVTPGQVTPEDYDAWKANFGMTCGVSGAGALVVPSISGSADEASKNTIDAAFESRGLEHASVPIKSTPLHRTTRIDRWTRIVDRTAPDHGLLLAILVFAHDAAPGEAESNAIKLRTPDKSSSIEMSGLEFDVASGSNTIDIDLKSK